MCSTNIPLCVFVFHCISFRYIFFSSTIHQTYLLPFEFRHRCLASIQKLLVLQVENEYGFYEAAYGNAGKSYALWAAEMALSQNIGVPWVMCQQWDTPEPVVSDYSFLSCI